MNSNSKIHLTQNSNNAGTVEQTPAERQEVELQQCLQEKASMQSRLIEIENQLVQSQQQAKRFLADYQNLLKRQVQDRARLSSQLKQEIIAVWLEPLEHLKIASENLKDPGLTMVYDQFMQVAKQQGLEEIEALGKPFDLDSMDVVGVNSDEKATQKSDTINRDISVQDYENHQDMVVVKVVSVGYRLDGQVIRHAKVILGAKNSC